MDYFVIGVSHHQAPVEVREKFTGLAEDETHLQQLVQQGYISEYLLVSTCNRLEILWSTAVPANQWRPKILAVLASVSGLPVDDFQSYLYEYSGLYAVHHLFRVAGSLDSLILGEPQILGQIKDAYRQALEHGHTGPFINKLMHKCFQTAKRVRSETCLAGGTVSVAGAAVALARNLEGGDLGEKDALVLGAGPMAALAVAHLAKRSPRKLMVANRTQSRAEIFKTDFGAQIVPWEQLYETLAEVDVVICAVAVPKPILTLDRLEPILCQRNNNRPLTIIDIGVPRNAAHNLKHHPLVILKNIDDLNQVVRDGRAIRHEATIRAEHIITHEVAKFSQWLEAQASQPTAAALARKAESIRRLELARTLGQHSFTPAQIAALEAMTGAMIQRLIHDPLIFIKKTTSAHDSDDCQPRQGRLDSLCRVFNLQLD